MYKIGTSHMCPKCSGPVIAQEADDEVKRLMDVLSKSYHYMLGFEKGKKAAMSDLREALGVSDAIEQAIRDQQ